MDAVCDRRRNNAPLTLPQQSLCIEWRKVAVRWTRKNMRKWPCLRRWLDEAESIGHEAVVNAARRFRPEGGAFADCLAWSVRRVVQHAAYARMRTVRHPVEGRLPPVECSLDRPDDAGGTMLDMLKGRDDIESTVAARECAARVRQALTRELRRCRRIRAAHVEESVDLWLEHRLHGTTQTDLAKGATLSRGGVLARLRHVEATFESWAREVRQEAA